MINVACRDETLKGSVIADIKSVFPAVYSQAIVDEVNEVVFAFPRSLEGDAQTDLSSSLHVLQRAAQSQSKGAEVPKLTDMLDKLKLL